MPSNKENTILNTFCQKLYGHIYVNVSLCQLRMSNFSFSTIVLHGAGVSGQDLYVLVELGETRRMAVLRGRAGPARPRYGGLRI